MEPSRIGWIGSMDLVSAVIFGMITLRYADIIGRIRLIQVSTFACIPLWLWMINLQTIEEIYVIQFLFGIARSAVFSVGILYA
jgi:MFS family permease